MTPPLLARRRSAARRPSHLALQVAKLPPIMEEEEPEVVPVVFEQSMSERNLSSTREGVGGPVIEDWIQVKRGLSFCSSP